MRRTFGLFLGLASLALAGSPRCSHGADATANAAQLIARLGFIVPNNWANTIVPRMGADANVAGPVTVPDTLWSGRPTYFNFCTQKNPAVCGTWTDAIYLDGNLLVASADRSDCLWQADMFPSVNLGPATVRGGRHELMGVADINSQVTYPSENFNSPDRETYTWSPEPLPANAVTTSDTPPPPYFIGNNGYELDRTSPYAYVVAAVPDQPTDDLVLRLYTDTWHGSRSGFSVIGASSAQGVGQVSFVVGQGGGATVYPALSGWTGVPAHGYSLSWTDATGRRDSSAAGPWSGALAPGAMVALHEVWLTAGVPFAAALARTSGGDDLAFAVGPAASGATYWSSTSADANSQTASGTDTDSLVYTPATTGWHALVVYRATTADRAAAQGYVLLFGSTTLAVGGESASAFLGAPSPNPVGAPPRLAFGLARPGPARLELFDAQGRAVRTLVDGALDAGPQSVRWDLRDSRGAAVANGVYWVRLQANGRELRTRLVVLR